MWETWISRSSRRAINNGNFAGVYCVCEYFTKIVQELVAAPPESLPTSQNGVENCGKAYPTIQQGKLRNVILSD